ncbi:hypothetical protein AURDEDRAFT_122727 [Auricularia subglabra TFB-10046 SS5]|nr:hypothetical protein AURDEDRAFT_122727 [Auricularia subglabra TFB-10046 SS5]
MEALGNSKNITDIVLLVAKGITGISAMGGITTLGVMTYQQGQCISNMRDAWDNADALLRELQRPGIPVQQFFPKFLEECATQLDRILLDVETLARLWEKDPRRFGKLLRWLSPQKDCVKKAKKKLEDLNELAEGMRLSSREACVLRALGHPLPAPGEILCPETAKWPTVPQPGQGAEMMSPSEHRAYRRAQGTFALPPPPTSSGGRYATSQSSVNVPSPSASTTSLLPDLNADGWGGTLPGIPPAGEVCLPYLPEQAPNPRRLNSMPVPAEYAHFNQLTATPYGTAMPAPSTSPYNQAAYYPPPRANPNGMHEYPPSSTRHH